MWFKRQAFRKFHCSAKGTDVGATVRKINKIKSKAKEKKERIKI